MGILRNDKPLPAFNSRSDAFDFMFAERVRQGDDYALAAEKADKFADIIAKNKKLPTTTPKPKNGIEAAVDYVEQIASIKTNHPEVWDLVVGGLGGLISGFLTKGSNSSSIEEDIKPAEIDFDKIE